TAAATLLPAKCVCGHERGTFTLEAPADLAYNGEAKEATVTVAGEVGGEATPTVEYYIGDGKLDAAPTNRGTYTAKITVDDATAELEFAIGAKNISVATVTVTPLEYTGAAQSAGIVLKDGDYTLVKDTDYSITGTSSATNAGSYIVTITGKNNYQGSLEKTWTITQATPYIGTVTVVGGAIYDTTKPSEIKLTHLNTEIAGTFTIDENITLTANQYVTIKWTFTPDDANYKAITGAFNALVSDDTINSIAVKTKPSKTNYIATENFDPTGLVLTVTYNSGNTADVAYTNENKGEFAFDKTTLAKENTAVTVTYGEKTATVPVTVTNVVTITQEMLNYDEISGTGWSYNVGNGRLDLNSGFEFKIEGTVSERVYNEGTILSGTFSGIVYNYGTIAGGTFKEVNNYDDLSKISLTTDSNGEYSAVISKTTGYGGTVTVDGVKHEHNLTVKSYDNFTDETHNKNEVCENCPINYEKTTKNEAHKWIYTDGDILIRAHCECGQPGGSVTLVAPTDLNYTATAKAATLTGEIKGVDVLPEIKYYDENGTEAEPRNAGTYTAKITIDEATAELEFTIEKVVLDVTVTASSDDTLYTSSTTGDVLLTVTAINPVSGTEVGGMIAFDGAIEFKVGTKDYPIIFTPDDTNYDPVKTTVSLTVAEDTLTGIAVAGTPAKTEYAEGDKFDPTGLTVTATYESGATKEIEHELLTISPVTLAKGNTSVTVSYNGKTAEVGGITVRGKLKASDFAFTQPESCVYDKTAKAATVEPFDTVTGIGAITVNYYKGSTKLNGAPTNAGTYTVTIDVAEGTEYAAADGLTADGWTFTIDKADPVISPSIKAPSVVYDTTPVSQLSLSAGNSDGGMITFDGDITLEVGKKEYPVIFYPLDGNNYNTVKGTVEINVVKDVITTIEVTTQPTTTEYTYGEEF
ncbi:MAG: bacterial Ig-like domain-containing protein, partial [Oscillospiraceae bacterium]|nr:bacterial Ig-like domain-containing protein [Oscillospiraceae bacterium]